MDLLNSNKISVKISLLCKPNSDDFYHHHCPQMGQTPYKIIIGLINKKYLQKSHFLHFLTILFGLIPSVVMTTEGIFYVSNQ